MSDTVRVHMPKEMDAPARRIEVFTGAGRRRKWSDEEKAAVIAESYSSAESVCAVARRHGLTPSQLFGWRRAARRAEIKRELPGFVPAIVEDGLSVAKAVAEPALDAERRDHCTAGLIEVELKGVTVRVGRGADERTITAVIRALKA